MWVSIVTGSTRNTSCNGCNSGTWRSGSAAPAAASVRLPSANPTPAPNAVPATPAAASTDDTNRC